MSKSSVPIRAELVGGGALDGTRLTIPDDRPVWFMPVFPKMTLVAFASPSPDTTTTFGRMRFERRGIDDHGVRLFQYVRTET